MADLVSFAKLKLKVNTTFESFDYLDTQIQVAQYLPIQDKYDLIMVTLQKSKEDGVYNPIKTDMYFHLNIVYMYTNINFTEKQREDEAKLYDILQSNGIIDMVLNKLPNSEYMQLLDYMNDLITMESEYNHSIGSIVDKLVADLPKQAEAMQEIVDNFDQTKFQNVIDFAKAANGGRDIVTNL